MKYQTLEGLFDESVEEVMTLLAHGSQEDVDAFIQHGVTCPRCTLVYITAVAKIFASTPPEHHDAVHLFITKRVSDRIDCIFSVPKNPSPN